MAPFVTDTFTDTDNTRLRDHTPDTGGDWTQLQAKIVNTGSNTAAECVSNELTTGATNRTSRDYRNEAAPGTADYSVAVDLLGTPDNTNRSQYFVLGRMSPSPATDAVDVDMYFGGWVKGGSWTGVSVDSWVVGKRVSGTATILGSAAAPATFGQTVSLIMDGTTISLEVDATEEVSVTDSDVSQDGHAGVAKGDGAGPTIDNLSAEELAAGGTEVSATTDQLTLAEQVTTVDAVPGPPPNLNANAVASDQIDLSWDAVPGADGYDIERDGQVIVTNHQSTSYSDTGLNSSTEYDYRVRSLQQVNI